MIVSVRMFIVNRKRGKKGHTVGIEGGRKGEGKGGTEGDSEGGRKRGRVREREGQRVVAREGETEEGWEVERGRRDVR